MNIRFGPL